MGACGSSSAATTAKQPEQLGSASSSAAMQPAQLGPVSNKSHGNADAVDKGKTGKTEPLATLLPRLPAPSSEETHKDKPRSAVRVRATTSEEAHEDKPRSAVRVRAATSEEVHEDKPRSAVRVRATTSEEAHEDKPKSALRRRDRRAATCNLGKEERQGQKAQPSSHEKGGRRERRTQTVTFGQREILEFVPRKAGPDGKALCEIRRVNSGIF